MAEIRIDVPDKVQEAANAFIKSTGLTISDVVNIFMTHIATDKSLPFDFFRPNAETLQALAESESGTLTPTTIDAIVADIEEVGNSV